MKCFSVSYRLPEPTVSVRTVSGGHSLWNVKAESFDDAAAKFKAAHPSILWDIITEFPTNTGNAN